MSGWEENKGFLWRAVGVTAAVLAVWGISALVWGSRKREVTKENDRYLEELKARTRSGTPSSEALSRLTERSEAMTRLGERLRGAVFVLDGPFQEAKTRLDFDKLAKDLRDSISERGPSFGDSKVPFGFDEKLLRDEEGQVGTLLRRLAVVKRFVEAARNSGVASVRKIKHDALVEAGEKGLAFHRTVVPIQCVFDANEKSLIALLHDLMVFPQKGLAPTKLAIKVEERTLGTFRVEAQLCAVFIDGGEIDTKKPELQKAAVTPERY